MAFVTISDEDGLGKTYRQYNEISLIDSIDNSFVSNLSENSNRKTIRYVYSPSTCRHHNEQKSRHSSSLNMINDCETKGNDSSTILMPHLNINENNWPNDNSTYRADSNPQLHLCKDEAFNEWLAAKLEAAKYARQKKIEDYEEKNRTKQLEEKRLAQESDQKIREWFLKKELLQKHTNNTKNNNAEKEYKRLPDSTVTEASFRAWLEQKRQLQETNKLKKEQVIQQEQAEKKSREQSRINSEQKYKEWLKSARNKPKPVPLNQGILSLRGTISKIYINPIPWQFEEASSNSRNI